MEAAAIASQPSFVVCGGRCGGNQDRRDVSTSQRLPSQSRLRSHAVTVCHLPQDSMAV